MFLTMFEKNQNIAQTMHLTMLIAHPYTEAPPDLAHDLAQQTRPNLVTLGSFQCCHS